MIETNVMTTWTSGTETTIKIVAVLLIVCLVIVRNLSK